MQLIHDPRALEFESLQRQLAKEHVCLGQMVSVREDMVGDVKEKCCYIHITGDSGACILTLCRECIWIDRAALAGEMKVVQWAADFQCRY